MSNINSKNKILKTLIKILTIFLIIILTVLIAITIFFMANVLNNNGNVKKTVSGMIASISGEKVETIYALILGISEDIETELTDTIMLCAYNPDTQKAYMLSIPRDTYIGKNDKVSKYDKINSIYSKYGIEQTISYVEELTNIEIDYYAIIRTSALVNIIDIIGGVEFNVPMDMKYDDETQNLHIDLESGVQKLDGNKAEQLLRFRHNNNGTTYSYEYGDNDYGRMRTQREFIKETIKQTIQFKNILKVKKIVSSIFSNVETNITIQKLLAYVPYGMDFNIDNLQMEQLPGESKIKDNVWIFEKNKTKTKKLVEKLEDNLNNNYEIENTTGVNNINDIERIQPKK